nr:TonB-dependent receptor [Palleniella intestinalis]
MAEAQTHPEGGNTFTLSGRVTDENQDPLELATVTILPQMKVAFTNLKGNYSLSGVSADSVVVRFSMVGYKTKTRVLRRPKGKLTLQVQMFADNQIGEVVVTEKRRQTGSTEMLDKEDLKTVQRSASITGNAVEDMIQTQAGVSTHSELSSQYNVRGGAFDENSVYINNVEVYRPFLVRNGQQEGLSVINPDMVESVGFSTGGYEAKYGDKMSSALDIKYRRPEKFEANVMASLLGASGFVGFSTKKFSWSNGLRYKRTSSLLGKMDTKGEYDPSFLDYQTYMVYSPNKRWDISLLGNISENHYNFTPENRETTFGTQDNVKSLRIYFDGQEKDLFRTFFGTLGITRKFTEKTKLSLMGSAFSTKEQETYDIQGQYWLDQTETSENLGVGTYFEHTRNYLKARVLSAKLMFEHKSRKHEFLAGLTLKKEHIEEKSREYEYRDSSGYSVPHTGQDLHMIYTLSANNVLDATRVEAFMQDSYRFTSGGWDAEKNERDENRMTLYTLNYGVRFANWSFNKESIVSPRVSLSIVPGKNHDVTYRFAAGLYYQAPFYKELRDTSTVDGVTTALLNENIKSQRSIHLIAAYDRRFRVSEKRYRFSAELYYKALSNIVPYSVSNVKVVYYGTNEASGHIAGLDLKLYGEFVPGTDSWLSFSVMNTGMKLHGKSVPLPTDQRYAVNLFFTDYFPGTQRLKMALKLAFADGLPFAAPHRGVEDNNFRAPAYKRADIGMSYRLYDNERKDGKGKRDKKKAFRNIWLGVDCLNLFGINNVNSYYWVTDVSNNQYAVPNYLTGRQINAKVQFEF